MLFHASFDFPLPRFNHHHILLKVYHITCCSWLFRVRPSPLFSFSVECVSWYWVGGSEKKYITRSLGIGGPDVKRYHLQFGWTKCPIRERFEPRSRFNSRLQTAEFRWMWSWMHSVARSAAMFVVSQASTWLWHMRDLIYIVTCGFWTNRIV